MPRGVRLPKLPHRQQLENDFDSLLRPLGYEREFIVRWNAAGSLYRLDFAHPDARVNIELDGPCHRANRSAQSRDARRDARLRAIGWRVVRVKHD